MSTNVVVMADTAGSSPVGDHLWAFGVGLIVLGVLSLVVRSLVRYLHDKAETPRSTGRKPFSELFARFEQVLLFFACVAGHEVFGFALAGWLVMKSVSKYAAWNAADKASQNQKDSAHNRFLIFIVGTGLSVTAAGIAAGVYHWVLPRWPQVSAFGLRILPW